MQPIQSSIRYDMFDLRRSAEEAKRFNKCERIYHIGQELAWDGKRVLSELIEKHGGVKLERAQRESLQRIFAIVLWGELAAWRISAQLADRLVPLEAKMAATSQAHDEARHFYTMYDYLQELGYMPQRMDPAPEALLELVLGAPSLPHKLLGMQLMVETMALAIFQAVRESGVEPVLCELLSYYERDEARHVGLGTQYLPELVAKMSRSERAQLLAFQVRLVWIGLRECQTIEPDLRRLGIDVRTIVERARKKQVTAFAEIRGQRANGERHSSKRSPLGRLIAFQTAYMFPGDQPDELFARLRHAWQASRTARDERHPARLIVEPRAASVV